MKNKIKNKSNIILVISGAFIALTLGSCFTGVEGTGKISMSKKDIAAAAPSEEDRYMADLRPQTLNLWESGREFLVADDKFRLVAEGNTFGTSYPSAGDTLTYEAASATIGADGGEKTLITFRGRDYRTAYTVDKPLDTAMQNVTSAEIPMLIDLQTVENARRLLEGKRLWTRTALWYDDSMKYKKGRKFTAVEMTGVKPGNAYFPLLVEFRDGAGDQGRLLMNTGNTGNESRSFGRLFSLSDPRNMYRHITEEHWNAIQKEEVANGMTKEECRLALGNPKDVDTGHNYSQAMEIWYYNDGKVLWFVDGVLTRH